MMRRKFFARITALLFNVCVCAALSAATGFSEPALVGAGAAVSGLASWAPSGSLCMAIQKELWMNHIIEGLFADNSFLSKAYNADMFVNAGRTVHIPNAGSPPGVAKNRTVLPAAVTARTDVDLTFDLDEFTTNPIYIPHADTVELSYNKRESVLRQGKNKLAEVVSNAFLFKWSPASAAISTSGAAVKAHTDAATGNRKAFGKADVLAAMTRFNVDDVPQEGRYLLIDAVMHGQLLAGLTANESQAYFAGADVTNGVIGKLLSFNIMMRFKALRYAAAGAPKAWDDDGAATDNAAALAWHIDSVCRALGEVKAYESEGDPTWYGDIYSFSVRAGGRPMRSDVKGLLAIVRAAAA